MHKNVKEAESNIRGYFADKKLSKQAFRQAVFDTYLRNHRESLSLAEHIYNKNLSCLWAVVVSYYSMFYIANAVLYKMGYKVGRKQAHKVTADALLVFVKDKLGKKLLESYEIAAEEALALSSNIVESYYSEREKREVFQYETTEAIKRSKAKTSLERAAAFSSEMEKLL